MPIGKVIQEELNNKENLLKLRYNSSRLVFVLVCLLFFTNIFLYGAGLFENFFPTSISILYVLLIISLSFFLYFLILSKFKKVNKEKSYILIVLLVILSGILLLPLILK